MTLKRSDIFDLKATALATEDDGSVPGDGAGYDGDQYDREDRAALRRVAGLSTELEDITEVEYRQLRLERVVLAAVWTEGTAEDADNSMRELAALAETAGSTVLAGLVQRRAKPDTGTYLGSGKAIELRDIVIAEGADTVICDTELTPSQRRALEDVVKVKVIDRTALILDIFAQHAKSKEGKAQVELAQLQYLLPRLRGWGESMSRQAGGQAAGGQGMGSRGPGETKIELDRRRINTRMAKLRREIKDMKISRDTRRLSPQGQRGAERRDRRLHQRRQVLLAQPAHRRGRARREPAVRHPRPDGAPRRDRGRPPLHAGRHGRGSSASCRPSSSRPSGRRWRRWPTPTCCCTSSTARTPTPRARSAPCARCSPTSTPPTVREVIVVNKADAADPEVLDRIQRHEKHSIVVSARTGAGLDELRALIAEELPRPTIDVEVLVPYDRGDLVSRLHQEAEVLSSEHTGSGTLLKARVHADLAGELAAFAA